MKSPPEIDPRIKRTKLLLFQALQELLGEKNFDAITVQDIAERSTVNRGTVYAHYKDKFALLGAMLHENFSTLFEKRMGGESGTCIGGVRQLILAVCDFLGKVMRCTQEHQRPFEPIIESSVRDIVRNFLLTELSRSEKVKSCSEAQLRATAATWAICGTALDWARTQTIPAEELADAVLPLVATGLFLNDAAGSVERTCSLP